MADFETACTGLLIQQPFYGSLLMRLHTQCDPTLNPPTAAVSVDTLYYHPEFFAKLRDDEALFVLAHEIQHLVDDHLVQTKAYLDAGVGPDGKPLNVQKLNVAEDYVINALLTESGVGARPTCALYERKYTGDMLPADVYCDMPDSVTQRQPMDGHCIPEDGEATSPITPQAILQAAATAKAAGKLPAGLERLMDRIKRPGTNPWARLRQMVTTSLSGQDRSTWRRLNRRLVVRGIGVPGRVVEGVGHVGIVADTSGSIGDEMLQLFGGHMASIMDTARPKQVSIYWTDTDVARTDRVKRPHELKAVFAKGAAGGGATYMPAGVEAALADGCDVVVVLTDGYTPFGNPSKKPVIWAITTPSIRSPHGQSLHITA